MTEKVRELVWKRLIKYALFAIIALFGSVFGFFDYLRSLVSGFTLPSLQISPPILASIIGIIGLCYLVFRDATSKPPKPLDGSNSLKELARLFPTFYYRDKDLLSIEILSKSQELNRRRDLQMGVQVEAITTGGYDARIRKQVGKELWGLLEPIIKSKRRYRLSAWEKLLDLLDIFPY